MIPEGESLQKKPSAFAKPCFFLFHPFTKASFRKGLTSLIPEGRAYKRKPSAFAKPCFFLFHPASKSELLAQSGKEKTQNFRFGFSFAEKEGFEPPDLLQSTVFKTAAFDRSAISPIRLQTISVLRLQI